MNAPGQENKSESGELIQRKQILGTPFTAIKLENTKWFLTMGKHRLTEPDYEYEDLLRLVEKVDWTLIVNTVLTIIDNMTIKEHKD